MRAIVLVMDGVGCGELPDANLYGDVGSNTIAHIAEKFKLKIPTLTSLGFTNITPLVNLPKEEKTIGSFGKMPEYSPGKDSVTGHWEIAGIHLEQAFPVYPEGFPEDVISKFTEQTGRNILGNIPASGTAIINELGEEHLSTGKLIVYTSADSVFQIAAHEDIIPVKELYNYCEIAREILRKEHEVGRVIARPFIGNSKNGFTRTKYRKDYSVLPPADTIFDLLLKHDIETYGVGKIEDLFGGKGIKNSTVSKGNRECMSSTFDLLKSVETGMIMTNLVDFDMVFGHQRDVKGFADELELFDTELNDFIKELKDDDLLILTADHGNDPTHTGTDHTREYVPLLVYGKNLNVADLGIRNSFADIAKTIADYFNVDSAGLKGNSFLKEII